MAAWPSLDPPQWTSSTPAPTAQILFEALATGDTSDLASFVDRHVKALTLPWEASPLPDDWRSELRVGDAHEIGDLALTKYYDADDDCGLQEFWSTIDDQLPDAAKPCLLGAPFGPSENRFDPGRMGSYFQDPSEVVRSREVLRTLSSSDLSHFLALLEKAARSGRGLYVTF